MSPPPGRLHHLDAARAALLLLGLPFHVATKAFFESEPAAIAFQTSPVIAGWVSVTHVFRMFAFFMLAGYFAAMMRERKGARAWLAERVRRLGLPLLASLATLGVVQFRLQTLLLHKPAMDFFGLPVALDHLWFLIVLLAYCAIYAAIPVARITPPEGMRRAMTLSGPGALALLLALSALGLLRHCLELLPQLPDTLVETSLWHQFVFHAAGFTLGLLAWHGRMGDTIFRLRNRAILFAIPVLLAVYLQLDPLMRPALGKDIYPSLAGALTLRAIELPLAYMMALALFRALARLVRKPSRTISFFVDGALAIYLFHLVWVMALLPVVRSLPVPAEVQWLLASAGVLVLSVASYLALRTNSLTAALFCGSVIRPEREVALYSAPHVRP